MNSFLHKKIIFPAFAALALIGFGCEPEIDAPGFSAGEANFTKYVAYGDNYTAGFTNGGLTRESQETSYPAIIARQLALVGGSATFNQPLFADKGTGQLVLQSLPEDGYPVIVKDKNGLEIRDNNGRFSNCAGPDSVYLLNKFNGDVASLNNLGFPFLKMSQLRAPNLGNATTNFTNILLPNFNPYFERVLPDNDNRRYIDIVGQSDPTFFTVWLGLGDLLPYVTSGGTCTTRPSGTVFNASLTVLLDSLTKDGARGLIANIPDINTFGFASAIQVQEQLRKKNNNNNLQLWVGFTNGSNKIEEKALIFHSELIKIGQPDANGRPYGLDSLNPIANSRSLNYIEADNYSTSIVLYNKAIEDALKLDKYKGKVFMVDMKSLFSSVTNRVAYNGVTYSNDITRGNFISLDGYSLTPRGSAIVANRFIDAINLNFNAKIPAVNVNAYKGTQLP